MARNRPAQPSNRFGLFLEGLPPVEVKAIDCDAEAAAVLPVRATTPPVTAQMLVPASRRARVAMSGPVFLRGESRSWRLSRTRIAELLSLPRDGGTRLAIAGPRADAYFRSLSERVGKPPVDASFDVSGGTVRVIPARAGTELDIPATARALLRAATGCRRDPRR